MTRPPPLHRCLLFAAALAGAASASGAVVDLRGSATIASGLVRLGDVAAIDETDPQTKRQLATVSLGPAPAPGKKMRLTQQAIRERLLVHGVNLTEIEFSGQSVVLVESPGEAKSAPEGKPAASASKPIAVRPFALTPAQRKKAEQVVQAAFHRHYSSANSSAGPLHLAVEIPEDCLPELLQVSPDVVRFVEPGLTWGGPQTLTAQFPLSDGATHIVKMQAWLNESPQILTVKHAVPKGQVLKESDLTLIPAKAGESGLEHPQAVVGQEAARSLRPGAPLQAGDTNKIALVRNNDLVTVKTRSPGLKVTRVFRSTSSGGEGEIVNCVALEDPREKIQARVTGWHEAEIVAPASGPETAAAPPAGRRVFPAVTENGGRR